MKILILGGNGFVAKNLINSLKDSSHSVFYTTRDNGFDLRDYQQIKKKFEEIQPEAIINCASHVGSVHYVSKYAADVAVDNLQMALNIYKATTEVCPNARIINPLANCSFPGNIQIQKEDEWFNGDVHKSVYAYGSTRRMIYILAQCYKEQYNIKTVNFMITGIFGPNDHTDPNKTHALNGMIIRMIKTQNMGAEEFEIWGTGKPIREWIYIDDVVHFLKLGLTIEEDLTYPVSLAQNKGYSIRESAEIIAETLGYEGKLTFNPQYQDGDMVKIMDDTKFRLFFPDYKFFPHKKGIEETIKYYKSIFTI